MPYHLETNHRPQVAALPVRHGSGAPEVMLITSRETRRWLIPKGWPIKGLKDRDAAAMEAVQEAGVRGAIGRRPLGAYTYQKRLADRLQPCRVMVYRLDVDMELGAWRESDERIRRWFSPAEAAAHVSEPGLASMIASLAPTASDRTCGRSPFEVHRA